MDETGIIFLKFVYNFIEHRTNRRMNEHSVIKKFSDTVPHQSNFERCSGDGIVEVYLWDAYLLSHSTPLARLLIADSFDLGAYECEGLEHGRVCFRFSTKTWERTIRPYLISNQIPVTVRVRDGSSYVNFNT
jgi:hypothetical protein